MANIFRQYSGIANIEKELIYDNLAGNAKGQVTLASADTLSKYTHVELVYTYDLNQRKDYSMILNVEEIKKMTTPYPYANIRLYCSINANYVDSINANYVDYVWRKLFYSNGLILSATTGDGMPVSGYLVPIALYGMNLKV